jgi:tetratricopeptide (TPR) repeat protein
LATIARGSSFALRGADQDPKAAGDALGARYVLEGRLRQQSDQQWLSTALVNSDSGQQLWSDKVNVTGDSAPDALDFLLTGLASTLGARIDQEEQSRALHQPQSDLNVRDLIWRGRWHLNRMTKEDAALAKACFSEALAQEPNSPEAIIQSTWANLWELWAKRRSDDEIRAIRHQAQRAIIADIDDARGHMLAGIAEIWLRQPVRAEALLRHAIALNPSLVLAYAELGSVLYLKGEPAEAIQELNHALRLSPNDHSLFYSLGELAMAHLMLGRHAEAAELADSAIMRRSAYWYSHVVKINALARGGEKARATSALADLMACNRQFDPAFVDWLPFLDSTWNEFLKEGLNLARG